MSGQLKGEKVFRGIAVSAGVCRGKILVLHRTRHVIARRELPEPEVAAEIKRFEQSLVKTRQQITEIQRRVVASMSAAEADIFDAHLLMLEDRVLIEEVIRLIREQKVNADFAFHTVSERYVAALADVQDEYLSERAADLRDLTGRVLDNLLEVKDAFNLRHLNEPCILVSHDLSPSTTAQLNKKFVLGFATDIGGKTSHTAIMARSLDIPAIVGLQNVSEELQSGDYALLDGYNGTVIVNPTDQTLFEYGQLAKIKASLGEKLREIQRQPAVTLDGKTIHLSANIEDQNDIESVLAARRGRRRPVPHGISVHQPRQPADRGGAIQSLSRSRRRAEARARHHPHARFGRRQVRLTLAAAREVNPFLGWRAIRFCLAQPELFRAQLRAILRASAEGNVKMMYPMISGLEELKQANALVDRCKKELRDEKIPFAENLEIGAMIEIPSAALIADALARRVKFFSIGSNDLIQYTLAADRTNEKVSHLYEPTHPAILRLIKLTVDAAHANGIWAGVCGEIAGDPVLAPLLIGLGVDELSAAPPVIDEVKYIIRRIKLSEAQALAEFALQCESPTSIFARCLELARSSAPSLFENKADGGN